MEQFIWPSSAEQRRTKVAAESQVVKTIKELFSFFFSPAQLLRAFHFCMAVLFPDQLFPLK